MIRKLQAATLILCTAFVTHVHAGDIIDRIVATVNGRAILQSDWEQAVCYEAFMAGRPLEKITPEDRKAALDRLIDQELLTEQVHSGDLPRASQQQVERRIREIRKFYPDSSTEQGWHAALARYGLNERELENRVTQQMDLMRLVEARLRPNVQIDSHSIEIYYQDILVPQLRSSGAKQVPLAEVTPKIREVLAQQKLNDLLGSWLQNLRAESQIRTPASSPSSTGDPNP